MNNVFRNILEVITGIIVGGIVNMAIVMLSGSIIPLPKGVDMTNLAQLV